MNKLGHLVGAFGASWENKHQHSGKTPIQGRTMDNNCGEKEPKKTRGGEKKTLKRITLSSTPTSHSNDIPDVYWANNRLLSLRGART